MVASRAKIANRVVSKADRAGVYPAPVAGVYAEGRGISLEALASPPKPAPCVGYNVYLETLLQTAAAAVPRPDDSDKESVRSAETSGSAKSNATGASSTTAGSPSTAEAPPKLAPGDAAALALRTLHGPAITQTILGLQVHSLADLKEVAAAVFKHSVSAPAHTLVCADLVLALMPFMVTCFDGKEAVTLLVEVTALCRASLSTILEPAPKESCFGAGLLLAFLFERRLVPLADLKAVFATLLFPEAPPPDHAVNLACHLLLAVPSLAHGSVAGAQMAELLHARLHELKGRAYSDATRACIVALLEAKAAAHAQAREMRPRRSRGREMIVRS